MKKSTKKMIEKLNHQEKVNPGHRNSYEPPLRPRSTYFTLKTKYNRANNKKVIKEAQNDY